MSDMEIYHQSKHKMQEQRLRMGFRFEFDPANKILITRIEGELTDDLIREVDAGMRKRLLQQVPRVHVVECSSVVRFSMSSESVHQLARREPALQGNSCRRFFVMPSTVGFGIARMFQIAGEPYYDSMMILRSLDEVFSTLAIEQTHFEPLE